MPYNWAGTGHQIYDGSVYFNKFNTSVIIRYGLEERKIVVERSLPEAGFGNMAPYQWAGSTDIDFAADETGLWVSSIISYIKYLIYIFRLFMLLFKIRWISLFRESIPKL